MSNWSILSISPTTDRAQIRQAYMQKLPNHNPEDDPQGFLQLRIAYEEIIKELDAAEKEAVTPISQFMKNAEEIYSDFGQRIDTNAWAKLLASEVCQRLDTVDEVEANVVMPAYEELYNFEDFVEQKSAKPYSEQVKSMQNESEGDYARSSIPDHKVILQMSEKGLNVADIAKDLGIGQGEVKLILNIARK